MHLRQLLIVDLEKEELDLQVYAVVEPLGIQQPLQHVCQRRGDRRPLEVTLQAEISNLLVAQQENVSHVTTNRIPHLLKGNPIKDKKNITL